MIYLIVPSKNSTSPPHIHGDNMARMSTQGNRVSIDMPYDKSLQTLQNAKGYIEYTQHHGYHFTDDLADYAVSSFINANGEDHVWTSKNIHTLRKDRGITLKGTFTNGDFTYLANMYYSDFNPKLLSEVQCIEMVELVMKDPDGYDGMAFLRWTADVMGKHLDIPWKNFY